MIFNFSLVSSNSFLISVKVAEPAALDWAADSVDEDDCFVTTLLPNMLLEAELEAAPF